MISVVFFGTPEFVLPISESLLRVKDCKLTAVVTVPDRPMGRKQILTPSPVKTWALESKIPVIDSGSMAQTCLLARQVIEKIKNVKPALGILAAYGKIVPQELIDLFPKGILVIHPSLLPKYRGPSPVQAAILSGDRETGVTIIKMDEKVDHGPIVAQFKEKIYPTDTAETLLRRLFSQAAESLTSVLPAYLENQIELIEQDHNEATYTYLVKRKNGYIDPANPPSPEVFNHMIRAYYPWPGVWSYLPPTRTVLIRGQSLKGNKGKIIKFLPGQKIQVEGGKPMTVKDFLNGYPETKEWLPKIWIND